MSQSLRRLTEGATCIRQGGHYVGHWPTFLVLFNDVSDVSAVLLTPTSLRHASRWIKSYISRVFAAFEQTIVDGLFRYTAAVDFLRQPIQIGSAPHFMSKLEMWANAQRDGRPAEYRWRPLFNAAVS